MKFPGFVCLAAALLAASVAPATAATLRAVFAGTVVEGHDGANLFGVGSALTGQSIIATFVYDTERGQRTTVAGVEDYLIGGTDAALGGFVSPIISASMEIAGVRFDMGSDGFSEVYTCRNAAGGCGQDEWLANAAGVLPGGVPGASRLLAAIFGDIPALPADLGQPFAPPPGSFLSSGKFVISLTLFGGADDVDVSGEFVIASAEISPVAAVPLPAGGLLLAAAVAGLALARRRCLS